MTGKVDLEYEKGSVSGREARETMTADENYSWSE
jgi:hypothetical protein